MSFSLDTAQPILPPELERIIFLAAFHDDVDNVVNYLLVAKYIRDWVMCAMFEVVVIHRQRTYPKCITHGHLKKYGHHVRHLLLEKNRVGALAAHRISETLTLCPNVEDLVLWAGVLDTQTLDALSNLPLKRFSIDIAQVSHPDLLPLQLITVFCNITHLDLGNPVHSWHECRILAHFHALTHLAMYCASAVRVVNVILEKILPGLKVVVWWFDGSTDLEGCNVGVPRDIQDIRVVAINFPYIGAWENGARGKEDMWSFAEKIVRKRQANFRYID